MFKINKQYKHQNTLDMMILIVGIDSSDAQGMDLRVLYTNGRWLFSTDPERVRIKAEHFPFWSEVSNPETRN